MATFDEPERFPAQPQIFTKIKLSWINLDGAIPRFEEYYNKEEMLSKDSLARRKVVSW